MAIKFHTMPKTPLALAAIVAMLLPDSATAQETAKTDSAAKNLTLREFTIKAHKDAIETEPGKTIVNIQLIAGTTGKNLLEVLRRTPRVTVDGRGNISMTGKTGVKVLMDGRTTYLTGDDLKAWLEGITAEEVTQLELITQPSSRYDAEGNAGIINIKMKKTHKAGLNGIATLTWTKSLFEVTHNTLVLNYHKQRLSLSANLDYNNGRNGVFWAQQTTITRADGTVLSAMSMHSEPVEMYDKYNIRLGVDYKLSDNTDVGVGVSGAYYGNAMGSPIKIATQPTGEPVKELWRDTREHSLRKIPSAYAWVKRQYGHGSELYVNMDCMLYTKRQDQDINTEGYSNGSPLADQLALHSHIPINVSIYSVKADNTTQPDSTMKLECGLKHSYVSVDNAAYFTIPSATGWINDSSRTNRFLYSEHISAVYANLQKQLNSQWEIQAGLRGELANLYGQQLVTGETLSRHLPALFPSVFIDWKPVKGNSLSLSYSRRVERPHYGMLNPFNYYTFYNAYQRGNPSLLPQYSHNLELQHHWRGKLTSTLNLSTASNVISYATLPDTTLQQVYSLPVNFKDNQLAYLSITWTSKPRPWWELMVSAAGKYGAYSGLYNNRSVHMDGWGYGAWQNSRFSLGKYSADCYISYNSVMVTSPVGTDVANIYMNLGCSRKFLRDTTTVKVSIDDPFYIYRNGWYGNQPGLVNESHLRNNSRYVTFSASYNFGKAQDNRRAHRQSLPDEAQRI